MTDPMPEAIPLRTRTLLHMHLDDGGSNIGRAYIKGSNRRAAEKEQQR